MIQGVLLQKQIVVSAKKTINNLTRSEKCSSSTASTSTEEVNIACVNNATSVSLPQDVSEKRSNPLPSYLINNSNATVSFSNCYFNF